MSDFTLHMMVGLPRSGKSTKAREMGLPIVNPDSIRLALHGQRFAPEAEPFVWAIAHLMVEALRLSGATEVVLDATNTTYKRREEWTSKYKTIFHCVRTPIEVCKQRALADGHHDLLEVIDYMAESWDFGEPYGKDSSTTL